MLPNGKQLTVLLLLFLFRPIFLNAQDTLHLETVDVQTQKQRLSSVGKKVDQLDSNQLSRYQTLDLGNVLSQEATIHVKSYGPGALSSTALRGGSAAQTAIVWNGINIQNRMLGQVDLSLLPAFIFDEVAIEYGGSSALWGSGAVGGSVLLNNKTLFAKGPSAAVNLAAGSFGRVTSSARYSWSGKKFISTTKIWRHAAQNDYTYFNVAESKKLPAQHAAYEMVGLTQEFRYIISHKQIISLNAWLSSNHRQIPSFQGERISKSDQKDQNLRLIAKYECQEKKSKHSVQVAYLLENLDYNDSLIFSFSKNKVQSFILESESYYYRQKHIINYGINLNTALAQSDSYEGPKQISTISAVLGDQIQLLKNRLLMQMSARHEFYFPGAMPFTGSIGLEWRIHALLTAKLNAAKVYRQPTFNEWYWTPGGNPQLKPEQGYSGEGDLMFQKKSGHILFSAEGSIYSRLINNWILWLPGAGGNPSPMNVQQVWSRGTETKWKVKCSRAKWQGGLQVMSAYVLATVEKSRQAEDASLHRQIIYTPRYSGSGSIYLTYDNYRLEYLQQYTGYRFTSSDDRNWLSPYHYASLRFCTEFGKATKWQVKASCHNLFNEQYAVVAGRPMPLRYYELLVSVLPNLKRNKN